MGGLLSTVTRPRLPVRLTVHHMAGMNPTESPSRHCLNRNDETSLHR